MRTHLLVAADPIEFRGLERRLGRWRRLAWPLNFSRQAEYRGDHWIAVANGAGPARAARAVAAAAERARLDTVVSTGFCGGLDPDLAPGAVFVAVRVLGADCAPAFDAARPHTSRGYACGSIISIDRFVPDSAAKFRLGASGAGAVEMEAAGVALEAAKRRLPFYCVRAVTDTADESFRFDFDSVRDGDGRFNRWRIAGRVLRRPFVFGPEVALIYRRSRAAAESLGEFLADCEF